MAAKPKQSGLVFYEASHRYKLDGSWVPGVTTIIGVLDKPALPKWAAGMVATFVADNPSLVDLMNELGGREPVIQFLKAMPWQRRDEAGARGTTFHDFAERIVNGEEVEVPPEQVGMVESALAFMEDWDVHPVLVEEACASREHKWAGKLDLVADCVAPDWATPLETRSRAAQSSTGSPASRFTPLPCFSSNAYAHAEFYGQRSDEQPNGRSWH